MKTASSHVICGSSVRHLQIRNLYAPLPTLMVTPKKGLRSLFLFIFTRKYKPWSTIVPAELTLAHTTNWPHFMKLQSSLLCLQQSATTPYPKPDQSSDTRLRSVLIRIIPPLYFDLSIGLIPSGCKITIYLHYSWFTCVPNEPPTSPPFVL
jgi:hypothetical protein